MKTALKTSRGFPFPFGVSRHAKGVNFALFSSHAVNVSLCLFEPGDEQPFEEIHLDPKLNRTGTMWHIFVYDIPDDYEYGYRVDGPYDPFQGHFFDNRSILLDPYAKSVATPSEWGSPLHRVKSHINKGVIHPLKPYDWEEDAHPLIPTNELIIYEMHVRGFTQDLSSGVSNAGTFSGMIEKIPHLKALGINAVELLPIHEFNETDHPVAGLHNYWGYSTLNFFSPTRRYGTIEDFKDLVKALHKEGIEVILDVVYNHTAEGNDQGPTLSFKGLENSTYYMLGPNGEYYNFSGCGNTFNCQNPVVRELIRDSLRYWVTEMHVDGFRFDLASILTRDHDGIPLERPPLIDMISQDPVLSSTKLIAEAWDAAGLYQVGHFPGGGRWAEWNGKYRDDVRSFLKGSDGEVGHFATRLSGSEDLFGKHLNPAQSINFITAHDGFSLADLVSYNDKHNEANGEENGDGENHNRSWNCGHEGPTDDAEVLALRARQMRNLHLALMVSQGVPMVVMGDEYGHTKLGNNNTWCQDNRLNWFLWDELEKNLPFTRFFKEMIAFRKSHPVLTRSSFLREGDIEWHGTEPHQPDWGAHSRCLAFSLSDANATLYIAFNASFKTLTFTLPPTESPWLRIVETSLPSPDDFVAEGVPLNVLSVDLLPHTALLLKNSS